MGRFFSPGRVAVALGLLASLQAEARANCFHGFVRCTVCSGGYGYYAVPAPSAAPVPGPAVGSTGGTRLLPSPTNGNETAVSAPPASPALSATAQAGGLPADAGVRYFPQSSSYAAPAYSYSYGGYAAPSFAAPNAAAAPAFNFFSPGSFLRGFNRNGQLMSIPAGARLTNPQELGSFLFQTLKTFGQNRSKAELINMGIQAFFDVLKFTPIGADLSIIEDIAELVLSGRQGGSAAAPGAGAPAGGAAAGANTVTATVPGGGPYKVTIIIEPASGAATTTTQVLGGTTAPPPQDGPADNPAGEAVAPPPTVPDLPAPEAEEPRPAERHEADKHS
jgi:hypothetical protein